MAIIGEKADLWGLGGHYYQDPLSSSAFPVPFLRDLIEAVRQVDDHISTNCAIKPRVVRLTPS